MAATDKAYRNQKWLDYVFAVSCVLLLFGTLWMFVQDYNREFKVVQREFRDVESGLTERQMLDEMPETETVKEKQQAAASARKQLADLRKSLEDRERQLNAEREQEDNTYRTIKADRDSRMSYYDIEVEELGEARRELAKAKEAAPTKPAFWAAEESKVRNLETSVAVRHAELGRLEKQLDQAKHRVEEKDRLIRTEITFTVAAGEKKLSDAEDELKKVTGAFDRLAKATALRTWKISDTIRALPILDGFESPTKIRQIVLPELTIDYGGFRDVPRYDRCTTCHLAIDRSSFTREALASLGESDEANKKLGQAREFLEQRKKSGESLGFEPSDLPRKVKAVPLSAGQITQYCVHPRTDLFVDSNSPHPSERFGCTSCHAGQGSATDFFQASHSPATFSQGDGWHNKYHWEPNHFWDFPMLSSRFVESSCLKCHHQVTDLIRHGSKEEAPKLLRGYNLLRENGCFGCHEIAGLKNGRWVGPDVRLEPVPALDLLSSAEQEKAKSDPANPPGTYRKVGPSLRRLSDKTNEEWARKWLLNPRGFREDTRMPHFYGLSTNSPDVLPPDQKKFPDAEIHSIAHYLFTESKAYLQGDDTARKAILVQFNRLQKELKEGPISLKDRKELIDTTRRLVDLALLSHPDRAADINSAAAELRSTHDKILELLDSAETLPARKSHLERRKEDLEAKGDNATDSEKRELEQLTGGDLDRIDDDLKRVEQEMPRARDDLEPKAKKLLELSHPVRLDEQIVLGNGTVVSKDEVQKLTTPDPKTLADRQSNGRVLFTEKGCLACHSHDGTTKAAEGISALEGEANFGPNLTRIAAKVSADPAGRRWLLQWILNPNIHHPRTRMPITHLKADQASDIAEWLLSQDKTWDGKDPAAPDRLTLVRLARVYLSKAPGMAMADVEKALPAANEEQAENAPGVSAELAGALAAEADERELLATDKGENSKPTPVDSNKLKWYIGKKSINRLGCFGCHDIPGFENAKPIGTALNEWGKKDGDRLAFEDSKAFIEQTFSVVSARDDPARPNEPAAEWTVKDGKKPYEKFFLELLEHHQRQGFLHLKLTDSRSFDFKRLRTWDDRLRMPQFQFSRLRTPKIEPKKDDESDVEFEERTKLVAEDFERRKSRAESEAREAVMTFVLGLVADPVSLKHVYNPGPDKLAVVKGRQVLDQFNCGGCHQARPGVYEFKSTPGAIKRLEENYTLAAGRFAEDHRFVSHNAWAGTPANLPNRLTAFGSSPRDKNEDNEEETYLDIRLTDALRFTASDGVDRDLPAASFVRILAKLGDKPADLISRADPYGGTFADLLSRQYAPNRYPNKLGSEDKARSALPPPLIREGERVQPKWLYQFLLNPTPIRPEDYMLLRMPRFNMSPDDAKAIVNYFGAVDKLSNPGIGLTYPYLAVEQHDNKYWRDRTAEYARRLGKDKLETKVQKMQPVWEAQVAQQLNEAKVTLANMQAALKSAKPENKPDLEKAVAAGQEKIKELQGKLEKKDFAELRSRYETEEVYATDAFRLLTSQVCLECHDVGPYRSAGAKGPNLELVSERIRPEWALAWIANPARMFPYETIMPQNYPRNKPEQYNDLFEGTPMERVRAVRDVLLDLPRLIDLPANRPTSAPAAAVGGK